MALTMFQKRMAARRGTSSLDRLTRQYQENIKNITGEYESSYADYTKKRAETMAPYEAAVAKYRTDAEAYQTALAGYKDRYAAYSQQKIDLIKNPVWDQIPLNTVDVEKGQYKKIVVPEGQFYSSQLPSNYKYEYVGNKVWKLSKKREMGDFTEQAPTAPTAPTAPDVPEFDTSQFEQKKAQAEQTFSREKGELKGARLAAVSRKERRPLLQGVKA